MFYIGTVNASLIIGIPYFKPPYVINRFEGFDIDLMRDICKKINETCSFSQMEFEELYSALNDGSIDLAIGAITISDSRKQYYIFSMPYKISLGEFIVLKGSNINSIHDLDGKIIGAIWASDFGDYLEEDQHLTIQKEFFEEPVPLIAALNDRQVNAIFIDSEEIKYWLKQTDTPLKVIGKPISIGDGFGIMALPKNRPLIQSINQALMQIEQDGSYTSIYSDYFDDK